MRRGRGPRTRSAAIAYVATVLAAGCGGATDRGAPSDRAHYEQGTHLVLLGTGTPNAEPDRSGPAVAVIVDGVAYLVDAGPGVVRRAAAAAQRGITALEASRLGRVFITHLHSDHTVGLPDLIFTPWVLERDQPLEVYGPAGIAAMTDHLLAAFEQDIGIRIDGLEPANSDGYHVMPHEIQPGVVYEDERVRVTAFAVRHGSWPEAYGYRFETIERTIVISGDAVPSESIVEFCNGCDILVHEVYSQAGFERREPEWQRYHRSAHTSAPALAELATRARPGLLVLYHQLLWGATPDELVAEIRGLWGGQVVFGRDLEVY